MFFICHKDTKILYINNTLTPSPSTTMWPASGPPAMCILANSTMEREADGCIRYANQAAM